MSNSFYDLYEVDSAVEEEGVWVDITKEVQVKVAALGNKKHLAAIKKLEKPYKQQIRKGTLDPEVEEDIHTQAIAKTVLIDWKGMKDKDGKDLPYNSENAYKILSDPNLKRFKADILFLAKEAETFKTEEKESELKNSKTSSTGNSSTGTKSKNSETE